MRLADLMLTREERNDRSQNTAVAASVPGGRHLGVSVTSFVMSIMDLLVVVVSTRLVSLT